MGPDLFKPRWHCPSNASSNIKMKMMDIKYENALNTGLSLSLKEVLPPEHNASYLISSLHQQTVAGLSINNRQRCNEIHVTRSPLTT